MLSTSRFGPSAISRGVNGMFAAAAAAADTVLVIERAGETDTALDEALLVDISAPMGAGITSAETMNCVGTKADMGGVCGTGVCTDGCGMGVCETETAFTGETEVVLLATEGGLDGVLYAMTVLKVFGCICC